MWEKVINRVTATEQDLKDTFTVTLFSMFKLEVLDHNNIALGKMIEKFLKKEPCIFQR